MKLRIWQRIHLLEKSNKWAASSELQGNHFSSMAQQDLGGQSLIIKAAWSRSNTPHLVQLHCTHDQPIMEISIWQHTTLTGDIHTLHSIQSHNPSKQWATDPCLRPHSHWRANICLLCLKHKYAVTPSALYCNLDQFTFSHSSEIYQINVQQYAAFVTFF